MSEIYYESSDCLTHHGIKGQKWGVRRFQDKNGALTSAGRKRYISEKTRGIDRDIHSFDKVRKTGIIDKKGRVLLTKEDVADTVNALITRKAKMEEKYGRQYDKKVARSNNHVEKKYVNEIEKSKSAYNKNATKLYINAYNKMANEMNSGKFRSDWEKKHGSAEKNPEAYNKAFMERGDKLTKKYFNASTSSFLKSDKNYKKAEELVKRYGMESWSDMAKDNAKFLKELDRSDD